jgi:hypothetical protein
MQPKIVAATQSQVECELHPNHPLRLIDAAGRRVQCLTGVVWITAYGQSVDVFLRPGGVYVVPNGGLVLAEAIGHCRMRVDLPRSFDYGSYRGVAQLLQGWKTALVRRRQPAANAS